MTNIQVKYIDPVRVDGDDKKRRVEVSFENGKWAGLLSEADGEVGSLLAPWLSKNVPDQYAAPQPSAERVRADSFKGDASRLDLMARLKAATPAQIDTFIANQNTIPKLQAVVAAILKAIALDARN